jgi:Flp pilus assembly protein TadG
VSIAARCRTAEVRGERGAVAGGEALLFSVLLLLAGAIVLIDAWAALDTRAALGAAAREFTRSYTEQHDPASADLAGTRALRASLSMRGVDPAQVAVAVDLPVGFGPCAPVEVVLRRTVPWVQAPFLDHLDDTTVEVRHRELIDAHREVMPSADHDATATPCAEG